MTGVRVKDLCQVLEHHRHVLAGVLLGRRIADRSGESEKNGRGNTADLKMG